MVTDAFLCMIVGNRVMGPRKSICDWVVGEPRPPKQPSARGGESPGDGGTAFISHCRLLIRSKSRDVPWPWSWFGLLLGLEISGLQVHETFIWE